jgi:hypothetical protein
MKNLRNFAIVAALGWLLAASALSSAQADPFAFFNQSGIDDLRPQVQAGAYSAPGDDEVASPFHRQIVDYRSSEAPGTIIIDTPNTYLYLVLGGGKAMRYGIGVGREGFSWSGVKAIERKAEWPDWTPPPEMIARQPYLPRFMAGGETNPLGARAMYLSGSLYRIHGRHHRPACLFRLHPLGQRRRDRPLQSGPSGHQGGGTADDGVARGHPSRRAGHKRASRADERSAMSH